MKTLALDHLGIIAAHIRTSMLKFKRESEDSALSPLDEVCAPVQHIKLLLTRVCQIMSSLDTARLQRLVAAHQDLQSDLCRRSSEDQAFDVGRHGFAHRHKAHQFEQSARELTAVIWGHELALVLQDCDKILSDDEDMNGKTDRKSVKSVAMKLKSAMRGIWDDATGDVFDIGYE